MNKFSRRRACIFGQQTVTRVLGASLLASWLYSSKKSLGFEQRLGKNRAEIIDQSGDFIAEIKRLKKLAFSKKSNLYRIPIPEELPRFKELAIALIDQNIPTALAQANALGYELVRFVDRSSGQILYGIREKKLNNSLKQGWGSYFINPSGRTEALIEVPHPLFDRFTPEIGAKVFLNSGARGFLIAGAHRHTNPNNAADVCDMSNSVFQTVHQAWVNYQLKTWQIHGFRVATKTNFPKQTAIVLSDGKGQITPEMIDLNRRLEACNFKTYAYNTLSASDSHNEQVNATISGQIFSPLAATQNRQGIYCHRLGVAFTHLELEQHIRYSQRIREQVAEAIANSIRAVANL